MPIDPNVLYNSFQSYVNTFIGGWFRPQTDFQNAVGDINNDIWEIETRRAEKSQEARDNLGAFLSSQNCIVQAQNSYFGIFLPPSEYGRFASARIITHGDKCVPCRGIPTDKSPQRIEQGDCSETNTQDPEQVTDDYYEQMCERQIDMIDNQRWGAVCEHLTKPPTLLRPKMTQISSKVTVGTNAPVSQISFKVAPRTVSVVVLDFYTRPGPFVFGYAQVPGNVQTGAGDQIIYNVNNSKPLQWPSTMINEFLVRLGERYGFFTRDQFMAQVATQQKMIK